MAWLAIGGFATCSKREADGWVKAGGSATPLYTHPQKREWVGLTDEEFISLMKKFPNNLTRNSICSIEAKLKHKNGYAEEKNT